MTSDRSCSGVKAVIQRKVLCFLSLGGMTHTSPPAWANHRSNQLMTTSMMFPIKMNTRRPAKTCHPTGSLEGKERHERRQAEGRIACESRGTTNLDFPHGNNSRRSTTCPISKPCRGCLCARGVPNLREMRSLCPVVARR